MSGSLDADAIMKMMASMPKIIPMTIVHHPYMMKGKAWQIMDDGHLYAFIHSDDLAAIPTRAASLLDFGGIPVRTCDDEMRAVFIRGLDRLAAAEETALTHETPRPAGEGE